MSLGKVEVSTTSMKLLSRDEFRTAVKARDDHRCVRCGRFETEVRLDAHHIIDWVQVNRYIMATVHNTDLSNESLGVQLMADLDLATFGSEYEEFKKVGEQVIAEYWSIFSHEAVIKGRLQFLNAWKHKVIFYSPLFSHLNSKATENIEREIVRLATL